MTGKKIKYPCYFSKEEMDKNYESYEKFNDKHLFRYSLECPLKGKDGAIAVILMNPSYADENNLDDTLSNVKTFLEEKTDYSKFLVLNIFPIRTANSKGLKKKMKDYGKKQKENNDYIIKTLEKYTDVLVACGSKYHKDAIWLYKYLENKSKKIYTYTNVLNGNGSPRHFSPQAYHRKDAAYKNLIKLKLDWSKTPPHFVIH